MYSFLQLVDYYFNTKLENSAIVKHVQNAHTLVVSLGCGVGLAYYKLYSDSDIIPYLHIAVGTQCAFDLFLNSKPDLFIHHIIAISMVSFSFHYPELLDFLHCKYAVIISSELSTLFIVSNQYLAQNTTLSAINTVFFISTFFYTRLFVFAKEILFDETLIRLNYITSYFGILWNNVNIYSFLSINIYWGSIFVKGMYKKLREIMKTYHTSLNAEYLMQYTLFFSPVISASAYTKIPSALFSVTVKCFMVMDLAGLAAVSVSSFNYHNALYNTIGSTREAVNVLADTIFPFYVVDIITIHIRSFLLVSVSLLQLEDFGLKCILITNNALFHIIALYIFYDYHRIKRNGKKIIIYDENESFVSLIVKVPLIIDTAIIAYSCADMTSKNHIMLATFMICATLVVKPFYEMNHFFFHLLLIYQSYGAALGIVATIQ